MRFVPQEIPSFSLPLTVQGEVSLTAGHGVCIKGIIDITDSPLAELLETKMLVSDKTPEEMPRKSTFE